MKITDSYNYKISVVIATIGGDSLKKTIESINKGIIIPNEIIVVIPSSRAFKTDDLSIHNVRVVITPYSGQVKQRLEGFRQAKYDLVMQLDDDMLMDQHAIEYMTHSLNRIGPGNVVGPSFYDPKRLTSLNKFDLGVIGFIKSISSFCLSSAPWGAQRMGKVTSIGIAYSLDPELFKQGINYTEWLPGGCVMSFKQDLIIDDFFPYAGKAYSEDVIHSLLRNLKGIKHCVDTKAKAYTRVNDLPFNWNDFLAELKVRLYIVNLMGGSKLKLLFWSIFQLPARLYRQSSKV